MTERSYWCCIMDKKEITKQNIIKAAIKEFSSNAYYIANTNNIAKSAGVSKGTVFLHFISKKQLYLSCLEYILKNNIKPKINNTIEKTDDFFKLIENTAKWKLEYFKSYPIETKFIYKCMYLCPAELQQDVKNLLSDFSYESSNFLKNLDISKYNFDSKYTTEKLYAYIEIITLGIESKYRQAIKDNFDSDDLLPYFDMWYEILNIFKKGLNE